jgi:phosphatidylserine decarboxylase
MKDLCFLCSKKIITRLAGALANQELPPALLQNFIRFYNRVYKVDLTESQGNSEDYKTFNEFFKRDIDFSKRKVNRSSGTITSPVDGKIIRMGAIKKNDFYSAKGVDFSLGELVGEKNAEIFTDGYYMSIYLSPSDHHRIYAPFDGEIFNFSYFDGKLLPVNNLGLKLFPKLFCINERLLTLMRNQQKKTVGILKIGAMIVGGISTQYPSVEKFHSERDIISSSVKPVFAVKKAEQIASFELGSMVLLLFAKGEFSPGDFVIGQKVKVGEKIGTFLSMKK